MNKTIAVIILINSCCLHAEKLQVVTANLPPFNYLENGQIKGRSTVIVEKVLSHAGIDYDINIFPWVRSYQMALHQENVLIYSIVRIPSREKHFKWVGKLGNGGTTILYRLKTNTHINPTTIEQAKKLRVVVVRDSMNHNWLVNHGFKNIVTTTYTWRSLKILNGNRADLFAFDLSLYSPTDERSGMQIEELAEVMPLFRAYLYMAVSTNTSDDTLKISAASDRDLEQVQLI
jgi:polar amino acid transport system substrate-binding protein